MSRHKVVAITGANGYLGTRIRAQLESAGWDTIALVRAPGTGDVKSRPWRLGDPLTADLNDIDALVHCAYDMTLRTWDEIKRVNVEGTRVLLRSASERAIERILVLSSMSAYAGTTQLYGKAKLEVEALTLSAGGIAVRPGLVYGIDAEGMVGTLRKLVSLRVAPVIAGSASQYPVMDTDFTRAIANILGAQTWTPEVFGIAQPTPVPFRRVLSYLALQNGSRCLFVPVPWQCAYLGVKLIEHLKPSIKIRSDSLLGLVHSAPCVPPSVAFPDLLNELTEMV